MKREAAYLSETIYQIIGCHDSEYHVGVLTHSDIDGSFHDFVT